MTGVGLEDGLLRPLGRGDISTGLLLGEEEPDLLW